jgi:Ran GTPase-activating protein (RanGAP) involved in mRNA processing and transport
MVDRVFGWLVDVCRMRQETPITKNFLGSEFSETTFNMTVLVGTVRDVVLLHGDVDEKINYEGNKRFLSFLEQFRVERGSKRRKKCHDTQTFADRNEELQFSQRILDQWKSLDPPGRFLEVDNKGWLRVVCDMVAGFVINRALQTDEVQRHAPVDQSSSTGMVLPVSKAWKSLQEKLNSPSSSTKLVAKSQSISDAVAEAVAAGLKHNATLTILDLSCNDIGDIGGAAIGDAIRHNSTLTSIRLGSNNIGAVGASAVADAIRHNSTLTTLNLRSNKFGNHGASLVASALKINSTLMTLDMSDNHIGKAGVFALANAIRNNSKLMTLDLGQNSIGDAAASALANAVKHNSSLRMLCLRFNNIGDAGASAISDAIVHRPTLTTLDLRYNKIRDAAALAHALTCNSMLTTLILVGNRIRDSSVLADAIRNNSTLKTLHLESALRGSGVSAIAAAVKHNTSLTDLHLGSNEAGNAGASAIADMMRHNYTLTTLNLHRNQIGDERARAIAGAIKRNSTLTSLDLSYNHFGNAAASSLAHAIKHNSTLRELHLQGNIFSGSGASALADALNFNTMLTVLDLWKCEVDDVTAQVTEALHRNSGLRSLCRQLGKPLEERLASIGVQGMNQKSVFCNRPGPGTIAANASLVHRLLRPTLASLADSSILKQETAPPLASCEQRIPSTPRSCPAGTVSTDNGEQPLFPFLG